MNIKGLKKFSLLDYPEEIAAVVFTGGCDFRCPFCHNPSLALDSESLETIDSETFFAFLSSRVGRLDGVCVTGGEPLLQRDLPEFIRKIRALGFAVKLDTNGSFPDRLEALLDERLLDYVAMDVKNTPEDYARTAGLNRLEMGPIFKSAKLLMEGAVPYEFRTTVTRELHSPDSIRQIGRWLRGAKKYVLQNFHYSGPLLGDRPFHSLSSEEMAEFQRCATEYFQTVEVKD